MASFEELANEIKNDTTNNSFQKTKKPERGIVGAAKRGYKSGVSGLLLGADEQQVPEDENWYEHLASLGGELVSDLPAMIAGGEAGAIGGALLGSAVGPIGATAGATIGAGAAGFGLTTAIKEAFKEYREFAKSGTDLTFGEFLERSAKVAKETGKSAIVGAATAQSAKLLPLIAKIPGADKLLNTRIGKSGVETALEFGGLTASQAAVEQQAPTMEQLTDNLAALVGFKTAHALSNLGKNTKEKFREGQAKNPSPFSDEYNPKNNEAIKNPENVQPLDNEKIAEKPLVNQNKNESISPFSDEYNPKNVKESEAIPAKEEVEKDTEKQPSDIQSEKSWFGIVNSLLPDSLKTKAEALSKKILNKTPQPIKDVGNYFLNLKQTARQKMYFDMLGDHIGKRNAKIVESQFNWKEALENAQKESKFTKQQLEEMQYYRQRTGNPFIENDTFQALEQRLPKHAKEFVDKYIDTHFKKTLQEYNDNPFTKNIDPREGLEDIYLPGLYKDHPKTKQIVDEVSRQFKTKNPFSNEKVFLSYLEAFQKKGLEPRYKNIVELMQAYDRIMIKSLVNQELIGEIRNLEKKNNEKLIVNSSNGKAYKTAKELGYVPFDDLFLRRYVSGKKNGKPTYSTTTAPALVHPDFADAFQGVFRKDAYKPESIFFKAADSLRDTLRFTRVSLSPFHYGALMEHALAAIGPEALQIKKWTKEAQALKNDKDFMKEAAEVNLHVHEPIEKKAYEKGQSLIDKAIDLIPEKIGDTDISPGLNKLKKGLNYLFEEFHPNIKIITYKRFVDSEISKLIKEGKPPSPEETKTIKKEMAKLVNDLYGGQSWETQRFLNNPNTMKWLRRIIGYPDWSVSSIKQAANVFSKGVKGKTARKFWLKYVAGYLAVQGALKFINSGWEQTDKKSKSINGLRFNPEKAWKGLTDSDPTKWYMFSLPDVDVKIAGHDFNPGRDAQNKKLYAHFGKQALEIAHYIQHPFDELFAKSNPLIQIAYKQIMGSTPYEDTNFAVRGKYKNGKILPWDATEPNTLARAVSRGKSLVEDITPFGLKTGIEKGVAPYIASGFGTVPVSKGMSLYKSEKYIEDAIRNNDVKSLNKIRRILKENSYDDKQINRTITKIRNRIQKEKKQK